MWKGISKLLFLTLTVSRIRGHLAWSGTNQLHPVQGLFVKPSIDGTTGDLYVAATEDHGVDEHWLTDQPINFLPTAPATVNKPSKVPVSFSTSFTKTSSPHEETVTNQKRAIITSPRVKYSYALPTSEGPSLAPYPYVAVPVAATDVSNAPCSSEGTPMPSYPQFSPFHYFYPQMMAAVANAMTPINDAGKDGSNPNAATPYWPHAYSYPYQYVMVDPSSWLQGQASTSPATNDSDENV